MRRIQKTSELERKKILLEIDKLNKPWYKKSEYLQIIVPLFLGIGSLIYAFGSGLIDKQKMDLQITKKQLQYDIEKFNDKKDSLNIINSNLQKDNHEIKSDNITLVVQTKLLKDSIKSKSDLLKSINEALDRKTKSEYAIGCDLHINKLEHNLQSINGSLMFDGLNHYIKLRHEYLESKEYKDFTKEIYSRKDIDYGEQLKLSLSQEYSQTNHYKLNRKRHKEFLLKLRDSLFKALVKNSLNKCSEKFEIYSLIPQKPNIRFLKFNRKPYKSEDDSHALTDSLFVYIRKK